MHIDAFCRCHIGAVRKNNEDNFYLCGQYRKDLNTCDMSCHKKTSDKLALFAVADGMGGEMRGEEASLLTVKSLLPCEFDNAESCALCAVSNANLHICAEIERHNGSRMGSTLVALYVDNGKAVCCNVGDSRGYLLRDGKLFQLSIDHTRVAQMVALGAITQEQAKKHPARNELIQHLGIFEEELIIEPHFSDTINLQHGDVFLLCSDGLTDMVSDEEIKTILAAGKNSEEKTTNLLSAALSNGGKDNVTVLTLCIK